MRKLLLQLTPSLSQVQWLIFDAKGQVLAEPTTGKLEQVKADAKGCEVWVSVPCDKILFKEVKMPEHLNTSQLAEVIPCALEDQGVNMAGQHCVIGQDRIDNKIPVIVVSSDSMDHWVNQLKENGIKPYVMIPNLYLLPLEEALWHGYEEGDFTTIRTGKHQGFCVQKNNLIQRLSVRLMENNSLPPRKLIITIASSVDSTLKDATLPLQHEIRQLTQNDLKQLGKRLASSDQINLLSGKYQSKPTVQKIWKSVLLVLCFCVLWVGIKVGGNIGHYYALTQQRIILNEEIDSLFKQAFPNARSVQNPRLRVEQKIREFEEYGSGHIFFQLLNKVESALVGSTVQIEKAYYENEHIVLDFEVPTFTDLEKFISDLKALHFAVNQNAATVSQDIVKAQIQIEPETS